MYVSASKPRARRLTSNPANGGPAIASHVEQQGIDTSSAFKRGLEAAASGAMTEVLCLAECDDGGDTADADLVAAS